MKQDCPVLICVLLRTRARARTVCGGGVVYEVSSASPGQRSYARLAEYRPGGG